MFRRTVAILLIGLMLYSNYVFAQTTSTTKPSLQEIQVQALERYRQLQKDAVESLKTLDRRVGRQAEITLGSIIVLMASTVVLCFYLARPEIKAINIEDVMKIENPDVEFPAEKVTKSAQATAHTKPLKNELSLVPPQMKDYLTDYRRALKRAFARQNVLPHSAVQNPGEISDLFQFVSEYGMSPDFLNKYELIQKELDRALTDPAWEYETTLKRLAKENITLDEANYITSWCSQIRKHRAELTPEYLKSLFSGRKAWQGSYIFKGSITPHLLSLATLKKAGLLGAGLFLISLAANVARPQDAKVAQRLIHNPDLFLQANAAQLQEIAQNPLADAFCREYTKALSQLAALPAEDKKLLMAVALQLNPQKRMRQELTRSLRTIKAR